MAHPSQALFFAKVKEQFPEFFDNQCVLEVGSLDINGSIREHFTNCQYVGIDVGEGPGVDRVLHGEDILEIYPPGNFDVVVSAECLEHNPYWDETFANMVEVARPGGLVAFSCASEGRPEHGTAASDIGSSPLTVNLGWTYYKNLGEQDFAERFNLDDMFGSYMFYDNRVNLDLYFAGTKGEKSDEIYNLYRTLKDIDWC